MNPIPNSATKPYRPIGHVPNHHIPEIPPASHKPKLGLEEGPPPLYRIAVANEIYELVPEGDFKEKFTKENTERLKTLGHGCTEIISGALAVQGGGSSKDINLMVKQVESGRLTVSSGDDAYDKKLNNNKNVKSGIKLVKNALGTFKNVKNAITLGKSKGHAAHANNDDGFRRHQKGQSGTTPTSNRSLAAPDDEGGFLRRTYKKLSSKKPSSEHAKTLAKLGSRDGKLVRDCIDTNHKVFSEKNIGDKNAAAEQKLRSAQMMALVHESDKLTDVEKRAVERAICAKFPNGRSDMKWSRLMDGQREFLVPKNGWGERDVGKYLKAVDNYLKVLDDLPFEKKTTEAARFYKFLKECLDDGLDLDFPALESLEKARAKTGEFRKNNNEKIKPAVVGPKKAKKSKKKPSKLAEEKGPSKTISSTSLDILEQLDPSKKSLVENCINDNYASNKKTPSATQILHSARMCALVDESGLSGNEQSSVIDEIYKSLPGHTRLNFYFLLGEDNFRMPIFGWHKPVLDNYLNVVKNLPPSEKTKEARAFLKFVNSLSDRPKPLNDAVNTIRELLDEEGVKKVS